MNMCSLVLYKRTRLLSLGELTQLDRYQIRVIYLIKRGLRGVLQSNFMFWWSFAVGNCTYLLWDKLYKS